MTRAKTFLDYELDLEERDLEGVYIPSAEQALVEGTTVMLTIAPEDIEAGLDDPDWFAEYITERFDEEAKTLAKRIARWAEEVG